MTPQEKTERIMALADVIRVYKKKATSKIRDEAEKELEKLLNNGT